MLNEEINLLEDIISRNSKDPVNLKKELLESGIKPGDLKDLDDCYPFADPKLIDIVKDCLEGKAFDAAYIQSIDFNEVNLTEDVVGKIEEQDKEDNDRLRDSVMVPTFVTDWPNHKHEMVGKFELPIYDVGHMSQLASLEALCSPSTVTMIDYVSQELPSVPASLADDQGEVEERFSPEVSWNPYETLKSIQGPTLEEYLSGLGITTLEPTLVDDFTDDSALGLERLRVQLREKEREFSEEAPKQYKRANSKSTSVLSQIVNWIMARSRRKTGLSNDMSELGPIGVSDLNKALIYTGLADGKEHLLTPDECKLWEDYKKDGLDKVDPNFTLADLLGGCETPKEEIIIIASKPDATSRLEELKRYKAVAKPGDFFEVYNFSRNSGRSFSSTSAERTSVQALSGKPVNLIKIASRSDGIPTGDTAQKRGGSSAPRSQR